MDTPPLFEVPTRMSDQCINILLVGKTGAGKSSTANTILGDKVFQTGAGKSVTKTCYAKPTTIFGKKLLVIDAPGFCDTDKLDTAAEIDRYLLHSIDGIHVVALVLSAASRPTKEEINVIKALENKFGSDMLKFLVIIVTRADDLEEDDMPVEDFVKAYEGEAKDILRECCRLKNVIGFDNRAKKEKRDQQVKELLTIVERIQKQNKGRFYTRAMLTKKNDENRKLEEERQRKIKEKKETKKRKEEEFKTMQKESEEARAGERQLRGMLREMLMHMNILIESHARNQNTLANRMRQMNAEHQRQMDDLRESYSPERIIIIQWRSEETSPEQDDICRTS